MNYIIGNTAVCEIDSDFTSCADNLSFTRCKTLKLLDCGEDDCPNLVINNGLLLCDCGDSWNCNLCANDLPYFNTINAGQRLYFQFQQPDNMNGTDPSAPGSFGWDSAFASYEIFKCCDDTQIEGGGMVWKKYVGLFEQTNYKGESTYNSIQQISFDVNAIITNGFGNFDENHCFYFKFTFATDETGLQTETFCSEPFQLNHCLNSTVGLEGVFPASTLDCFGYYYGLPVWSVGSEFVYRNEYRVRGALELQSVEIEKELVTRYLKAVNSSTCEIYRLSTYGLPERVVLLISNILAARDLYANEKLYQLDGGIEKNNEIGSQWFIETKLKRCDCFPDFSCE
jgi:hypothetical protein